MWNFYSCIKFNNNNNNSNPWQSLNSVYHSVFQKWSSWSYSWRTKLKWLKWTERCNRCHFHWEFIFCFMLIRSALIKIFLVCCWNLDASGHNVSHGGLDSPLQRSPCGRWAQDKRSSGALRNLVKIDRQQVSEWKRDTLSGTSLREILVFEQNWDFIKMICSVLVEFQ